MNNNPAANLHTHVLTVHWQTPKWIDVQLTYLKRNLNSAYTTYSFLNGIEPEYHKRFDFSYDQDIASHAEKLNILARRAAENSQSTRDILLFIDGDAFPVQPIDSHLRRWLSHYPLAAVQRLEENHELQPHPCFCATTIEFWQQIRGDWRQGYNWQDRHGNKVTDVGGKLLGALEQEKIKWKPLLRTNQIDLHPLWFAVYDDVVYHHGAGFRKPVSRIDLHNTSRWQYKLTDSLYNRLPANPLFDKLRVRLAPMNIRGDKIAAKNQIMCDRIFEEIKNNTAFYRHFI